MGTHEFPLCIGAIVDTHIEVAKLNEHHPDYINRKGIVECDCKYSSQNVVTKWPRSVHDSRSFLNSLVNKILQKVSISSCETTPILFKFSYSVILHIPCSHVSWKIFQVVAIFKRKFFSYKWPSARITIKNSFGTWKPVLVARNMLGG